MYGIQKGDASCLSMTKIANKMSIVLKTATAKPEK